MSHFIALRARSPKHTFDYSHFHRHFSKRIHFTMDGTTAAYLHPSTRANFSFSYYDSAQNSPSIGMTVHYARPPYFGLEAAIELESATETMNLQMHDPQSDDPDFRDFDQTVFLESWNKGNTAAYRALLEASPSLSRFVFPSRRLQSIWQWNYYREELAAKLLNVGYRVWIASVVFLIAADGLYTGALWPDTIPVAMPVVELVEIGRRLLDGRAKPQGFNYSRILWEEFEQQTSPHGLTAVESVKTPLDYRLLHYKKTPPRLWHWAKALPVWRRPRNVCPPDRLIDEDAIRLSGNHVG